MKWTEPWMKSIQNHDKYNPLSKEVLISCVKWTMLFIILITLALVTKEDFISLFVQRSWIAPLAGFIVAWLLYTGGWLSPIKIYSGPNGIVRDKGGSLLLLPWKKISNFSLTEERLSLVFIDKSQTDFYIPKGINLDAVQDELEKNITKHSGPPPWPLIDVT